MQPADGDATTMSYAVKAQVGGKMAQIGSRLIDGAAAKLADDFFARFSENVAASAVEMVRRRYRWRQPRCRRIQRNAAG